MEKRFEELWGEKRQKEMESLIMIQILELSSFLQALKKGIESPRYLRDRLFTLNCRFGQVQDLSWTLQNEIEAGEASIDSEESQMRQRRIEEGARSIEGFAEADEIKPLMKKRGL